MRTQRPAYPSPQSSRSRLMRWLHSCYRTAVATEAKRMFRQCFSESFTSSPKTNGTRMPALFDPVQCADCRSNRAKGMLCAS